MHICTEVKMHIYDVVEKFYTLSKSPTQNSMSNCNALRCAW